jgi:hypothetical protein
MKPLGNKPGLYSKHPFAPYRLFMSRWRNQLPCIVSYESLILFFHGGNPMGGLECLHNSSGFNVCYKKGRVRLRFGSSDHRVTVGYLFRG